MRLSEERDGATTVETVADALLGSKLANAVYRSVVEAVMAVRLGLKTYSDVFDGRGEKGVGDAGDGSSGVVLTVAKVGIAGMGAGIVRFEPSTGSVEGTELDGDLGKRRDSEDRR